MKTIVVTDQSEYWNFLDSNITIMSAFDYLLNQDQNHNESIRVINLCQSYQYQSMGYYVSLLAEARKHKVLPSVLTIQDLRAKTIEAILDNDPDIDEEIQQQLKAIKSEEFVLSVYFGRNLAKRYQSLCRRLHSHFPMPLFRAYFKHNKHKWVIKKVSPIDIEEIQESHHAFLCEAAKDYLCRKRFYGVRKKNIYFDMAILHSPDDKTPPSDPIALEKFIVAGDKVGVNVELITKEDFKILNVYDALFIRETTAVNHYTYQFSRRAMAERLVVIDDPLSILRCTNKVYLTELLQKQHIAQPKTTILCKHNWQLLIPELSFPCVLKRPDGSFSQGISKVHNIEELYKAVKVFFKSSDLILAQEFTPSEFDWRIVVMDGEPLFACRYYMAKDHWQIYNWNAQNSDDGSGEADAVPLEQVPQNVLSTALKACKLIGDGLYGVDLKQIDNKVLVIEVNDNPNIDHGVEDALLGDLIYDKILQVFLKRMKRQHGYVD